MTFHLFLFARESSFIPRESSFYSSQKVNISRQDSDSGSIRYCHPPQPTFSSLGGGQTSRDRIAVMRWRGSQTTKRWTPPPQILTDSDVDATVWDREEDTKLQGRPGTYTSRCDLRGLAGRSASAGPRAFLRLSHSQAAVVAGSRRAGPWSRRRSRNQPRDTRALSVQQRSREHATGKEQAPMGGAGRTGRPDAEGRAGRRPAAHARIRDLSVRPGTARLLEKTPAASSSASVSGVTFSLWRQKQKRQKQK